MKKSTHFDFSVFIGRFQPFHNAHLQAVEDALKISNEIIIIVGSHCRAMSIRNPWDFETRKRLILKSIPTELHDRISIYPVRDIMYNYLQWISNVQGIVSQHVADTWNKKVSPQIVLKGYFKDDSSDYLNHFPQWIFISNKKFPEWGGTEIRKSMFDTQNNFHWTPHVSPNIINDLWKLIDTDEFRFLIDEYHFIENYKKQWKDAPYPPTFVTADAIVIKSGHVLLIERGFNPGKGQYALPGGFVNQNESIERAAIRELKEETKIDVPKEVLTRSIVESKIFDHPERSMRGRTITNAYLVDLGNDGELPSVRAGDDASKAFWVPIADIVHYESNFFEDHLYIISHFVRKR